MKSLLAFVCWFVIVATGPGTYSLAGYCDIVVGGPTSRIVERTKVRPGTLMYWDMSGATTSDWTLIYFDQTGKFSCVTTEPSPYPPPTPPAGLAVTTP
jgi:hypothetical protein